jgi:hypothetical protein
MTDKNDDRDDDDDDDLYGYDYIQNNDHGNHDQEINYTIPNLV